MKSHTTHAAGTLLERHFTVRTLAELWSLSEDTVQHWFESEEGVIKLGSDGARGKRRRITLRVPESVAERVYAQRAV
jgi:hypothetical protein